MTSSDLPRFLHPFSKPAAPVGTFIRMVGGEGATVVDDAGRRYVDALASLWYCQAGHGRREIIDAICTQATKLDAFHTFERFTNEPADELCDRLSRLAPMPDARVFLVSGGSEAVDTAIKIARLAHFAGGEPQRTIVISRTPSYHGTTFGGLAATGSALNQEGFGPLVGDIVQVPYDDLDAIDAVAAREGADRIAAIIAEPVIGAGGLLPPAPGYLEGLRERATAFGAFLILDEVITAFGRLGEWFGAQRFDVTPDLVTFAKGVSSGYQPVGGVLVGPAVRQRLEADPDFMLRHGHTYGGHPIACAAAIANLDVLEQDGLVSRETADRIGKRLQAGLEETIDGSLVVEVRGVGGMWAAKLGPAAPHAIALRDRMLDRGVIARHLGTDLMCFCPPLVATDEEVDTCVAAFRESLTA